MGSPSHLSHSQLAKEPTTSHKRQPKPCRNYAQGNCLYGDSCAYPHVSSDLVPSSPPTTALPPSYYPPGYSETFPAGVPVNGALDMQPPENITDSPLANSRIYVPTTVSTSCGMQGYPPGLYPSCGVNEPGMSTPKPAAPATTDERSQRSRRRQGSRSSTESGGCYYRTKPCRFYHGSGFCVKGDRCNFIHDQGSKSQQSTSSAENQNAGLKAENERTPRSSGHARGDPKRSPKRSISPLENGDATRNNFYPITWRVIGGGVLMGGPREVCQAFLAGHCDDGLDCKYSHPSAADELAQSVAMISPPVEPHYPFFEGWTPASPLFVNPFAMMQMHPSSPLVHDTSIPPERKGKALTIDAHAARPLDHYFASRVVLDGNTLLPKDDTSEHTASDDELSPPTSRSPSPGPKPSLLDARSIVRPVSTPPYSSPSFTKVVRLFAAEMP